MNVGTGGTVCNSFQYSRFLGQQARDTLFEKELAGE